MRSVSLLNFAVAIALPVPFLGRLYPLYFERIEAPRIKATIHAVPRERYTPRIASEAPSRYDLVATQLHDSTLVESYFDSSGIRTEVVSLDGRWTQTRVHNVLESLRSWCWAVGFVLLSVAVVAYGVRTRQFFYYPGLKGHPPSRLEANLMMYAIPILLATMISTLFW